MAAIFFVIPALPSPQNCAAIAIGNPFTGADTQAASWFHNHVTPAFATVLRVMSEPGSGTWIGCVLLFAVLFFVWKRSWVSLVTLVVAVPGGMLLNEFVKVLVQRPRPILEGPFVDWSGYSFASGHTIGATLLYGQLLLFCLPLIKRRYWRATTISMAAILTLAVGFSRIALGAHYLSDVLAAMFFGIVWLAICLAVGKPMRMRYNVPLVAVLSGVLLVTPEAKVAERP